jgi:PleD family two-component response regulator
MGNDSRMDHTATPAGAAAMRVLLLDDDSFLLELLEDMLDDMGDFTIFAESDARRALATVAAHRRPADLRPVDAGHGRHRIPAGGRPGRLSAAA